MLDGHQSRAFLPVHALSLGAAAFTLGLAVWFNDGTLSDPAIVLVGLAILFALWAFVGTPRVGLDPPSERTVAGFVAAAAIAQLGIHLTSRPGLFIAASPEQLWMFRLLLGFAAVPIILGVAGPPSLRRLAVPLMLTVYFALGSWVLRFALRPNIDVIYWHLRAYSAFGEGVNPYAITMPNIYGHTRLYAPGLASATEVFVGYPYPPLTFLLGGVGHLLAGDYRWAYLVAMTAGGALIAYARPGPLATAAAALFLFTPRGFLVLGKGWTEACALPMLALTVFVACRAPRWLPLALGALLATKQYLVLVAPLALLLLPSPFEWRRAVRMFALSGMVACALTLPMALWNLRAFVDSVVAFQGKQPFRADSLSFMAWTATSAGPVLPAWLAFATIPIAWGLAAWRAPRSPAGFAASSSVLFLLFFAVAKQAFVNYYFFIVGTLACAIAAFQSPQSLSSSSAKPATDGGGAGATAAAAAPSAPSGRCS